ncbi:MAG: hypothetical protein V4582_04190 [Pseudomonadota bacterium]
MLREIPSTRQIPGESPRRWFTSIAMDLIVWFDGDGQPKGFQFCYDKGRAEQALTWQRDVGLTHMQVDDGESGEALHYKAAPMLAPRAQFDRVHVAAVLAEALEHLPPDIAAFVSARLRAD